MPLISHGCDYCAVHGVLALEKPVPASCRGAKGRGATVQGRRGKEGWTSGKAPWRGRACSLPRAPQLGKRRREHVTFTSALWGCTPGDPRRTCSQRHAQHARAQREPLWSRPRGPDDPTPSDCSSPPGCFLASPPDRAPALANQLCTPHRSVRTHHLPTILLA